MVTALVLVTAKMGTELSLIENFRSFDAVEDAWSVYGSYDLIVKLNAQTLKELNDVILNKIRKSQDVENTTTLIKI